MISRTATRLPIVPLKVDSDKLARAAAVTPTVEAGKVFLPESAPWLDDYRDEMAAFPAGVHDDYVDSTTQALNYLRASPFGFSDGCGWKWSSDGRRPAVLG